MSAKRRFSSASKTSLEIPLRLPKFLNHRIRDEVLNSAEPLYVAA